MSTACFQKSLQLQSDEQEHQTSKIQSLLVQIKIKNKPTKFIKIANIHDDSSIDQEIKWFIQTNNLKDAAFSYIKQVISAKIAESQQARERTFQLSEGESHKKAPNKIQINITKSKHKQSIFSYSLQKRGLQSQTLSNEHKKEPPHLMIKLNTKVDNSEATFQMNQQNIESFVFNSSFTLPSSIGEKERSFLTDKLFQNAFQTNQNHSENFQNISEIQQFQDPHINIRSIPPLGIKNYQDFKKQTNVFKKSHHNQQNRPFTPRKPVVKITSIKQNRQNNPSIVMTPVSASRKKLISTKDRKEALITPKRNLQFKINQEFKIYDAQNLEGLVLSQQKQMKESKLTENKSQSQDFHLKIMPQYLQQDLKALYTKLTLNNPFGVEELHSQYVSYQKLGRQQLLFMGALFQKIDHRELNHLNFSSFKKNSVKYCFKELEQMHNVRYRNQTIEKHYNNPTEFRIN